MRTAVRAVKVAEPFAGYMRVRRFAVWIADDETPVPQAAQCNVLSAPGHDVVLVAALALDEQNRLRAILKAGDTRPARVLRGEPYVKLGTVGGRLDHSGEPPANVAKREVIEEIGGKVIDGSLYGLGDKPAPTMPSESTEADRFYTALVRFEEGLGPKGDGGGLELPGLMVPRLLGCQDFLRAVDQGRVGEGARARVGYARAFDKLGFIPSLDRFIYDLPPEIRERFDSLGMGAPVDLRHLGGPVGEPAAASPVARESEVNDVKLLDRVNTHLEEASLLVDARVAHAIRTEDGLVTVGSPFRIQFLHVPYDRVKLAVYANDPERGPVVLLEPIERLPLAIKGLALDGECPGEADTRLARLDVLEAKMHIGSEHRAHVIESLAEHAAEAIVGARSISSAPRRLGSSFDASPGQSDLRYHLFAVEVPLKTVDRRFVPLSDALAAVRAGEGDAGTEAILLRLADDLDWIPGLRMSRSEVESKLVSVAR